MNDPEGWARICRTQAALTCDPQTREFLLELAAEYEVIAAREAALGPDDSTLQDAVAERLFAAAARMRAGQDL